jgi:hypothetical protein
MMLRITEVFVTARGAFVMKSVRRMERIDGRVYPEFGSEPQINADERRFQGTATTTPFTRQVKPRLGTSRSVSQSYLRPSEFICGFKVFAANCVKFTHRPGIAAWRSVQDLSDFIFDVFGFVGRISGFIYRPSTFVFDVSGFVYDLVKFVGHVFRFIQDLVGFVGRV